MRTTRSTLLAIVLALPLAGCGPASDTPVVRRGRPLPSGAGFTVPGLALDMVAIAPGQFGMGSPAWEAGRDVTEGPRTRVAITRPFWLGRTPVTHAQWIEVMGTDLGAQARRAYPGHSDVSGFLGDTSGEVAMHYVSWNEAMAFCGRLTARMAAVLPEGYAFTLPTEAQWEYACRAGTDEATYAGPLRLLGRDNAPDLDPIAWYAGNSSVGYPGPGWDTADWPEKQYPGGVAGPRRVGLRQPNAWGLCDMLGNLHQWCRDAPSLSLPGGSVADPVGQPGGTDRAVRGGSWHSDPVQCRCAARAWDPAEDRSPFIGFRVALAPVP
jgi:formylglycine-generating enzyme required for sulfatase activity